MNDKRTVIDSVLQIKQEMKQKLAMEIKAHVIKDAMVGELGMSFRKIVKGSLHLNRDKNLILRQEWAMRYLSLW